MYSKMQDLAVGLCEVDAGAANVDFGFSAGNVRPALNAQEPSAERLLVHKKVRRE